MALLKASINQIHQEMPGVEVGTIVTSNLLSDPQLFQIIEQYSDFIDYTYYPFNDSQMQPMSQVSADLNSMAAAAGEKPFAFTLLRRLVTVPHRLLTRLRCKLTS
jgi:hypothetical protein